MTRLQEIFDEIERLKKELVKELQRREEELSYELQERAVFFREGIVEQHRQQVVRLRTYLRRAKLRNIATTPIIWLCLIPALLMDLVVSFFQAVCFPIYKIPKVRRKDYIVIDRQNLKYLNIIEKLNCIYCGYFNGVIAYVQEVAARTEQYWCPIKHAIQLKAVHSRYSKFCDFGDSERYRKEFHDIRNTFDDIEGETNTELKANKPSE